MVLAKTLKMDFKEQILQVNNFIESRGYRSHLLHRSRFLHLFKFEVYAMKNLSFKSSNEIFFGF